MVLITARIAESVVPLKTLYLQEIQNKGFSPAHRAMLCEIKNRLAYASGFARNPDETIREAVRMHTRLVFMAAFAHYPIPPVEEVDQLFIEVFGEFSRPALTGRLH